VTFLNIEKGEITMSPLSKAARNKRGRARNSQDKNRFGVRVVVEFTGHIPKNKLLQLSQGISSVLTNHMENGGGG
jgi:hypothetical protein